MSFLTMAFADDAFQNERLSSPKDLFMANLPREKKRWRIAFKQDVLDLPLFRAEDEKPIKVRTVQDQLARLGKETGFEQVISTYCIRRGAANAISGRYSPQFLPCSTLTLRKGVATASEQNHILGHSANAIFDEWYRNQAVTFDVMSAFCGTPSKKDLLQAASSMMAKRDCRYPHNLTEAMRDEVENEPEVVTALSQAQAAKHSCMQQYRTLTLARKSDRKCAAALREVKNKLEAARRAATRRVLKAHQARFREEQPVTDLDAILQGQSISGIVSSESSVYFHEERRRIVQAFQMSTFPEIGSDADRQNRIALLTDLVHLCSLEEPHHAHGWRQGRETKNLAVPRLSPGRSRHDELGRTVLTNRTCIFCYFDESYGRGASVSVQHSRASRMRRHALQKHSEQLALVTPVCPDPACLMARFVNAQDFLLHIDRVHNAPLDRDTRTKRDRPASQPDERGRARVGDLTCLFCHFAASYDETPSRKGLFTTLTHTRRHAETHLGPLEDEPLVFCPDPACAGAVFSSVSQLVSHADSIHWTKLARKGRFCADSQDTAYDTALVQSDVTRDGAKDFSVRDWYFDADHGDGKLIDDEEEL